MKIIYINSEFTFKAGIDVCTVRFENSKPPYLANIFKNGDYKVTVICNNAANKSNAKEIIETYLEI